MRDRHVADAQKLFESCRSRLTPLGQELAKSGYSSGIPETNCTITDTFSTHRTDLAWRDGCCVVMQSPGTKPIYLWSGVGLELTAGGLLRLAAAHIVAAEHQPRTAVWTETWEFELGSAHEQHAVEEAIHGLHGALHPALEEFARRVEAKRQGNNK